MTQPSTTAGFDTVPLPLAMHLAMHTVLGLFCAFAGGLNLIDPTKILPQGPTDIVTSGVGFLTLCGLSWGYVFGVFMDWAPIRNSRCGASVFPSSKSSRPRL